MDSIDSLSVVIPVYNSEATLGRLVEAVIAALQPEFTRLQVILVNDGSADNSHAVCRELHAKYPRIVCYLRLAKNFGEHNAVMCGLRQVDCDGVAIIDDDFQNPPGEILKLAAELRKGYDVVYSYYESKRHSWFRNLGSRFNDWSAGLLLKKPRDLYLSSFKAMNRFLVRTVTAYEGPYPYLDALILRSTNNIGVCLCEHQKRESGRSNYTLTRLMRLWLNMSTSTSIVPLRLATILGFAMSFFGFALAVFFLLSWLIEGPMYFENIPRGWASIIVSVTLFSGIQLCTLGMIGEYLGRLFLTQNRHPQFVVRETCENEPEKPAPPR